LAPKKYLISLMLLILFYLLSCMGSTSDGIYAVSGNGSGELELKITITNTIPVFSGSYSCDILGINIPPLSTPFNAIGSDKGYAFSLPGVYIPGKPNVFTVSAGSVKNLNIGLKKAPVKTGTNRTRIWVTNQIIADKNNIATTTSDLLSPGVYNAKIFGDAVENVSQVNLTMTLVKKIIVSGPFRIGLDTTGFPSGNYSIAAKALNGSFSFSELSMDDLSINL